MEQPIPVYFILGAHGSGRREVLADLVGEGLLPGEKALVLLSDAEPPSPADEVLRRAGAEVGAWRWKKPCIEAVVEGAFTRVFIVADGRASPVDQLEALRDWMASRPVVLARILFVASARLFKAHPELEPWCDACAHFADVVLLTQLDGIEGRWVVRFEKRYRDNHHPFLFEAVRGSTVKNPALILDPQARRVSQVFDEAFEYSDDSEEEVDEAQPENDRYFESMRGGKRVVEVPDIAPFLVGPDRPLSSR